MEAFADSGWLGGIKINRGCLSVHYSIYIIRFVNFQMNGIKSQIAVKKKKLGISFLLEQHLDSSMIGMPWSCMPVESKLIIINCVTCSSSKASIYIYKTETYT